jgi:hypothetical protein
MAGTGLKGAARPQGRFSGPGIGKTNVSLRAVLRQKAERERRVKNQAFQTIFTTDVTRTWRFPAISRHLRRWLDWWRRDGGVAIR